MFKKIILSFLLSSTAFAVGKTTNDDIASNAQIANSKLANMANATFKCRTSAGTGLPEDCTPSQVNAILGNTSPLTTKGDLYGYSTANARVPVGADTYILTADSTQALGLKWAAPAATGVTSVSGTAPIVSSGGTTPAISCNVASGSQPGCLSSADWTTFNGKGAGSVTSVAQTVPSWLSVAGSPITSTGTLAITAATGQTANQFLATPNGSTGAIGLRSIVAADVPTLNQSTTGNAATSTAFDHTPTKCSAGNYPLGVDTGGNAVSCTSAGSGSVTSVTGTAPVVSSGGATPAISMAAATTSVNGYLTSTDWNTFNGKQAAGNYITGITGDVVATGPGSVASTIQAGVVSNSKIANMAQATIKGRASGAGTGAPTDLTGTQAAVFIDSFVGDSGSGGLRGEVPPPATGDANARKLLNASGNWAAAPPGAYGNPNLLTLDASYDSTKVDSSDALNSTGNWLAFANTAAAIPSGTLTGGVPNTTCTRNTTNAITGHSDMVMTLTTGASRQGEGCSAVMNVPQAFAGQTIRAVIPYITTGTINSGDVIVYAYDTTNNALIAPSSTISGISGANGTLYATFVTKANTQQIRLALYVARTATTAATVEFGYARVEQDLSQANVPVSDWTAYTPTFTAMGTTSIPDFWWRRVGDSIEIKGSVTLGTTAASEARISLPSGLTIDSTKIASNKAAGLWFRGNNTFTSHGGPIIAESGVSYFNFGTSATFDSATVNPMTVVNATQIGSSSDTINVASVVIPISGWSSGGGTSPILSLSDSRSFPMVLTATTTAPTKGTTTIDSAQWSRVGEKMLLTWNYTQTAAGSAGSGKYLLALPTGYSIDTTKQGVDGNSGVTMAASVGVICVDTAGSRRCGPVNAYDSTHLAGNLSEGTDSMSRWGSDDAPLSNSSIVVSLFAQFPVSGWTSVSSGTLTAPRTEITVDSGNGYGSTNTKIRRFTNIRKNIGDITYADSATAGGTFTVGSTGVYSIDYHDTYSGGQAFIGIVVNGTALSTAVGTTVTYAQGLRALSATNGAAVAGESAWTGNLTAGDIVYAQTAGTPDSTDQHCMFTITKVSN